MSKIHELAFNAEEIDELLDSVDKKTIYQDATQSEHGLMSTTDKTKLDALPTAQQIDGALNAKVDKVEGKGLSKNDYTDADKAKVASALQSETDPTVPSWAKQQNKPSYDYSEIGNTPDLSGFITKSVNDLTNYYLKSETYTKAEVAALIGAIQQFHYEIYATLPQSGESNVLYLIGPTGTGTDRYEEYVYSNSIFTKIGDTSIDLSGYVTTSALNTALADYTTTSNLTALLSNKADKVSNATNGNFAGLDANGNLTDSGKNASDFATASQGTKADTAYQKPQTGIPKSDLSADVQSQLNKHFKGWFNSLAELKAVHTAVEGDSAYVKDASPATTWSIYVYDATATTDNYWADSGTDADTSNVQTFASSQKVNEVHIVNDLTTGGIDDVLSAEQGKELNERVVDVEHKFTYTEYFWDTFPNSDISDTTRNIRSNGTWTTQYHAEFITVNPGDKVRIIVDKEATVPKTGIYAILRDQSVSSIDFSQNANFSTAEGFTTRIDASEDDVEFIVPFDGHILYHTKESSAGYNNSLVEKQYQEIVEGIDKDVEDLQESVGDIPTIKVDIYGGNLITDDALVVDMTWANMIKQSGYLQSTRWFATAYTSAIFEIVDTYNCIYIVGGSGGSTIFFTKQALPSNTNVNESTLERTYFATGKRSTSVFSIPSSEGKYILIPENSVYVYINSVGVSSASTHVPQQFVYKNVYIGFNCLKRIEELEEKSDNVKSYQDSYFGSNVVPYDITKSVGNTLIPINIEIDANGHVITQSIQERNIQLKAKQFCLTQWTCKGNIPYRGDSSNPDSPGDESGGTFSEGTTITGMPYSSVKEIDKYIGFDISVLTFMTAVNNPYSLLYTENVSEDNSKSDWGFVYHGVNCATYYGTVCSEFSSYATGMSIIIPTHGHKWLAEYAMKAVRLYSQTEDNLKIGDILVRYNKSTGSSMHCMVVVDLIRNSNGNVTSIKVAESTGSHVRFSSRTKIAETSYNIVVYRFIELYKNIGYDDSANEFIDLSLLPNPTYSTTSDAALIASAQKTYSYNNDICTFAGDKACFAEGDLVVLNYNLNNDANFPYTDIEVYKDDVLLGTYNIASIDQSELPVTQQGHALKLGTTLAPGDYKARCKNTNSESDYTYFEVIDTSHVTIESDFEKNVTTINFTSANGIPACVGVTNMAGGQMVMRELTDGEVLSGEIKSDFIRLYKEQNDGKDLDGSLELWIKLYFKGKYGRVTAKLPYMNVGE